MSGSTRLEELDAAEEVDFVDVVTAAVILLELEAMLLEELLVDVEVEVLDELLVEDDVEV